MANIDPRSLSVDVYDHYTKYYNKRGVGIITDHQFAFYSEHLPDDFKTHDQIAVELNQAIFPDMSFNEAYQSENDITIASIQKNVVISLPRDGYFSDNYYDMLIYYLSELNNSLIEKNRDIDIAISSTFYGVYETFDNKDDALVFVTELYEKSKEADIKRDADKKEVIIGDTLETIRNKITELPAMRAEAKKNRLSTLVNALYEQIALLKQTSSVAERFNVYYDACDVIDEMIPFINTFEFTNELESNIRSVLSSSDKVENELLEYVINEMKYRREYMSHKEEERSRKVA